MKALLRFQDLKSRNIAASWAQVARLIKTAGFPPGRLLGPNTRTWTEDEIDCWYEKRPTENPRPLQGKAKELAEKAKTKAQEPPEPSRKRNAATAR